MGEISLSYGHLLLAYSGCDYDVGQTVLASPDVGGLVASNNGYDWLGTGIYFWEADPSRAIQWAHEAKTRHAERYHSHRTPIKVRRPFAVGAVIKLGVCLDLTTQQGVELLREGFDGFSQDWAKLNDQRANKLPLPENTKDDDMKGRFLDFQVINYTCQQYTQKYNRSIDTVRSFFFEGAAVYETAGFREKTHVQICVRRPEEAIMAYFRVPGLKYD